MMINSENSLDLKIKCKDEDEMKERFMRCILGTSNVSLTDKEFEILFVITKHCNGKLTADSRKKACELLKISIANLNNNISRMSEKGIFVEINDRTTVYPVLLVDLVKLGFLKITFVNEQQ